MCLDLSILGNACWDRSNLVAGLDASITDSIPTLMAILKPRVNHAMIVGDCVAEASTLPPLTIT
jgi:hypothetical protein